MSEQNPGRQSRQAYIAFFAIVIGVAVACFVLPVNFAAVIAPFGLVGAIVFLALGYLRSEEAKRRAKMERGEGVVARWTLDAALWKEFVSLNEGTLVLPPIEDKRMASSDLSVEVVFAEDAIYVDGNYYTMDRNWGTMGKRELSYIELAQGGLEDLTPIRIPIPVGLEGDAERVLHHFTDP